MLPVVRDGGRHCWVTSVSQNPELHGIETVREASTLYAQSSPSAAGPVQTPTSPLPDGLQ